MSCEQHLPGMTNLCYTSCNCHFLRSLGVRDTNVDGLVFEVVDALSRVALIPSDPKRSRLVLQALCDECIRKNFGSKQRR